jgi:hypothetical protein
MIGICLDFVPPPTSYDQELYSRWWWTRPRSVIISHQWVYDFFKKSVDDGIIINCLYELPDDYTDYDTAYQDTYFSSSLENAQKFVTDPVFLQYVKLFQDHDYNVSYTILENVDPDQFDRPSFMIPTIIDPTNGNLFNFPFDESSCQELFDTDDFRT